MTTFFLVQRKREVSPISILIAYKGSDFRRTTGAKCAVSEWNSEKKRVRVIRSNAPQANATNAILDKHEASALKTIAHFNDFKECPNRQTFWAVFDEIHYSKHAVKGDIYFTDYFASYIERYRPYKTYATIYKKLKEYEQISRSRITFEGLNMDFYLSFQRWFYAHGYTDNYFGKAIDIIKRVFNESRNADRLHTLDLPPNFKTISKTADAIYLSEEELLRIYNLDIEATLRATHPNMTRSSISQVVKGLTLVRERFLIGAYTGLRVSDFQRLSDIHISDKYITMRTRKTDSEVIIPIHHVVRDILKTFDPDKGISDQKMNVHLKLLAMLAGITEDVATTQSIGGRSKTTIIEKYKLVCTHTARRSFATNAYKAGVPTLAIMKITGHTTEHSFMKYIRISKAENAELLSKHSFFTGRPVEPVVE